MAKYVYPAVFTPEEKGYSVYFPDLEGCYTCGDDLQDAQIKLVNFFCHNVCCINCGKDKKLFDCERRK